MNLLQAARLCALVKELAQPEGADRRGIASTAGEPRVDATTANFDARTPWMPRGVAHPRHRAYQGWGAPVSPPHRDRTATTVGLPTVSADRAPDVLARVTRPATASAAFDTARGRTLAALPVPLPQGWWRRGTTRTPPRFAPGARPAVRRASERASAERQIDPHDEAPRL